MGDHDRVCNTKLTLGTGLGFSLTESDKEKSKDALSLNLTFGLGASSSRVAGDANKKSSRTDDQYENSSSNNNNNIDGSRKRLKLSKEQTSVLEEKFKEQSTLSKAEKNDLAAMLGLKPRQVEVWFQNYRLRTKHKQTEIDYERLKKTCEELKEENKQLKKQIEELHRWKGN